MDFRKKVYFSISTTLFSLEAMLLQIFDINVVKQKFIKGQVIADLIAKFPQNDGIMVHEEFLDEYDKNS